MDIPMPKRDCYEILCVSRDADGETIKASYRRLTMKYHPDRNPDDPNAEEKFREIKEAADILLDEQKRQIYDRYGYAGLEGQMGGAGSASAAGFSDIFDMFNDFFGGSRGSDSSQRGADLQYQLDITLEQAAKGATVSLRIPMQVDCNHCNGSGARPGSKPQTCPTCNGYGEVRVQRGFLMMSQTCPRCHGRGVIITDPCPKCHGSGKVTDYKELEVKIPAGIDHGDRIRLSGQGEAGSRGAPPGDLYVQIRLKAHSIFQRQGRDLYCEVPMSIVTAALGGQVQVPCLSGEPHDLTIPAGTQTHKVFKLAGRGLPGLRGEPTGDLLCRVIVETPVYLNREQKAILEQLGASFGEKHQPQQHSFLDSVKQFFEGLTK